MTSVAIVLDEEYGQRLRSLLPEHRLWVVHSPTNRVVVEALWRETGSDPSRAMDVTIEGPAAAPLPFADRFRMMIDALLEHFNDVQRIEVIGASTERLEAVDERMTEAGLVRDASMAYKLRYLK